MHTPVMLLMRVHIVREAERSVKHGGKRRGICLFPFGNFLPRSGQGGLGLLPGAAEGVEVDAGAVAAPLVLNGAGHGGPQTQPGTARRGGW